MLKLIEQILNENDGPHKYSSTQVQVPSDVAEEVLKFTLSIPKEDLYTSEDGHGRELDVHVTVKYGLITNDASAIKTAMEDYGQKDITIKFTGVSLFTSDENGNDFDVVKIDVESEDLNQLHNLLGELDNEDSHQVYKPHCTIAYVKKGKGKKYISNQNLKGTTFTVDRFYFNTSEGNKYRIDI